MDAATGRVRWQFNIGPVGYEALLDTRDACDGPAVLAADDLAERLWLISLRDGRLQRTAPVPLVPGAVLLLAGPLVCRARCGLAAGLACLVIRVVRGS